MTNATACPICAMPLKAVGGPSGVGQYFSCIRCGEFVLLGSAAVVIGHKFKSPTDPVRAAISHQIQKMQKGTDDEHPRISSYQLETLARMTLPKPSEQADNLLLWLGDAVDSEALVTCPVPRMQAIVGGPRTESVTYVARHLASKGLIQFDFPGNGGRDIQLGMLFDGWKEYERIKDATVKSKVAFMAMKFGDPELDSVVDTVFRQAVAQTGFTLRVLSDEPRAGLIDDQLRVEIRRSRFLIADVTHENLGAYWEAGFAEGLGKPVIYSCKKSVFAQGKSHFDTNHHLTVMWNPGDPETAAAVLKATIRSTLPTEAILND